MSHGDVSIRFHDVSYSAGSVKVLAGLSFEVGRGETLALLGRSGSGKTTALRMVNAMLLPSAGSVEVAGRDTRSADPVGMRRSVGYVIQEFGLLPHWTVAENAALVLRLNGASAESQRARTREVLRDVGLDPDEYGGRMPSQLSGGQRQRVGVARALAAKPEVLLFDEPFGALDPLTRHEMQQLFVQVRDQYRAASVFVTHDLMEAVTIATKIAVLDGGRLEAIYTPQEFVRATSPAARSFLDTLPRGMTLA